MPEYRINLVLTEIEKLTLSSLSNTRFLLSTEISLLKKLDKFVVLVSEVSERTVNDKG